MLPPSASVYTNVPFQIVRPTENHSSMVVTDGLAQLAAHEGPVALVAVVGPYHSGKSFLLNAMLGDLKAFTVGARTSPETMGIWLCRTKLKAADGAEVWLMDSEGFFGPRVDEAYDAKVFTIATLMGAHVVYNTVKVIDQQAVSLLEMLAHRAQLFRTRSAVEARGVTDAAAARTPEFLNSRNFPPLTWVVEDFVQEVPELHREHGATAWLKTYLSQVNASGANDSAAEPQYFLTKLYKELNVHTLFLPATKKSQLSDLSTLSWGELTSEFRGEVQELKDKILHGLRARQFSGGPMTGRTLARALHFMVHSLQSGRFPELPSIWDSWAEQVAKNSITDADAFFRSQLAAGLNTTQEPEPIAAFNALVETSREHALDFYRELLRDFDVTPRTAELVQLMDVHFQQVLTAYYSRIRQWITRLIAQYKKELELKLPAAQLPMDPRQLTKVGEAFITSAKLKFDAVYDNFVKRGPSLQLGPMAQMPSFEVEPSDWLRADLQAILGATSNENEQKIQKFFKSAAAAADLVVQQDLKTGLSQLCSKVRVKELKREVTVKGWDAFNKGLAVHSWATSTSHYEAHKALVQQDIDEAMKKFNAANDHRLNVHFRTAYERVLGTYKTRQMRLGDKLPMSEAELQEEHEVLAKAALASLETYSTPAGLDLSDTDAFADTQKRLGKAINEEYENVQTKNVELWKVHSDEATRCAKAKNRALEQTTGTFGLFTKVPWVHKYRSRQHLRECFGKSTVGPRIPAVMQAKIFESWYNKDVAHEADRVGNNFMVGGIITLLVMLICFYYTHLGPWLNYWRYKDRLRYAQPPCMGMNMGGCGAGVPTPMRSGAWYKNVRTY